PMRLAESYFTGSVDIEGSIYPVIELKDYLKAVDLSLEEKLSFFFTALRLKEEETERKGWASWSWTGSPPKYSREMNREAIRFHYDVSNEFYSLWLDEKMVYSCAYFTEKAESLEKAQENKLDLICRKLRLSPGDKLLDIGCGWGALVMWAARHYGVKAHGITLSKNQYEYSKRKISEGGFEDQVTVELRDYRDIEGEGVYDKVSSVGMFEHVGLKNLPIYFSTVYRLLKPGGLFLNHGITHDEDGWKRSIEKDFILKYVFPDGELDWVSNIQRQMEKCLFEIHDVESMRPHYALTLREWVRRLEAKHAEALQHVSEGIYRVWRLYMAGCALQFEQGYMGLYQILAAKKIKGALSLPLTRSELLST
ncbi:MAG TPA: cyclopropane-fatty-acyl-phospholipid synthase family protein, partial [Burkholderiales bacterium]|nr:cyclopropane-fatty-acyl-phospholipid synthase family protein [Burkholderiales bacterium]